MLISVCLLINCNKMKASPVYPKQRLGVYYFLSTGSKCSSILHEAQCDLKIHYGPFRKKQMLRRHSVSPITHTYTCTVHVKILNLGSLREEASAHLSSISSIGGHMVSSLSSLSLQLRQSHGILLNTCRLGSDIIKRLNKLQ